MTFLKYFDRKVEVNAGRHGGRFLSTLYTQAIPKIDINLSWPNFLYTLPSTAVLSQSFKCGEGTLTSINQCNYLPSNRRCFA